MASGLRWVERTARVSEMVLEYEEQRAYTGHRKVRPSHDAVLAPEHDLKEQPERTGAASPCRQRRRVSG